LPPSGGRDTRQILWSNANVNENFPEPITPLLYSVAASGYYHYFRNLGRAFGLSARRLAAIDDPLRQIIGVHGARMYYNLTSIHTVLRAAPFGEQLAAAFNQFVGAEEIADKDEGRPDWRGSRVVQALELARIGCAVTWQYLFLTRRVETFERTADDYARRTDPTTLPHLGRAGLRDRLRGFMDIRRHRWKNASLADAGSPSALLARQQAERIEETARAIAQAGPAKGLILRVLLAWTQRSIQLRERARLKQALLYSRLRRVALAIGDDLRDAGQLDRR